MVFHPARRLAPSHGVHDRSAHLLHLFSDWLHHLPCARWREIFWIHRFARGRLLSHTGFARFACLCDAAVGDFDACSGFSPPMGPAHTSRALDDPNLALRICHGSARISNAVPMVSSGDALSGVARCPNLINELRRCLDMPCTSDATSDEPASHSDLKMLRSTTI